MKPQYSQQIEELDNPQDVDYAQAKWDITPVLLHNVLLMEVRSYMMKYKAYKKKEREMLTNSMKRQIEKIQNSNEEEDVYKVDILKKFLQDLIDHEDNEAAIQMLAKYHLEGEKPTKFFCAIMKKNKKTAQFCSLVNTTVDGEGKELEEILEEQSVIKGEVCEYYEKLYKHKLLNTPRRKYSKILVPMYKRYMKLKKKHWRIL